MAVRQRPKRNAPRDHGCVIGIQLARLMIEVCNRGTTGPLLHDHPTRISFVTVEPETGNVFSELTTTFAIWWLSVSVLGMKSNLLDGQTQQLFASSILDPERCSSADQWQVEINNWPAHRGLRNNGCGSTVFVDDRHGTAAQHGK